MLVIAKKMNKTLKIGLVFGFILYLAEAIYFFVAISYNNNTWLTWPMTIFIPIAARVIYYSKSSGNRNFLQYIKIGVIISLFAGLLFHGMTKIIFFVINLTGLYHKILPYRFNIMEEIIATLYAIGISAITGLLLWGYYKIFRSN